MAINCPNTAFDEFYTSGRSSFLLSSCQKKEKRRRGFLPSPLLIPCFWYNVYTGKEVHIFLTHSQSENVGQGTRCAGPNYLLVRRIITSNAHQITSSKGAKACEQLFNPMGRQPTTLGVQYNYGGVCLTSSSPLGGKMNGEGEWDRKWRRKALPFKIWEGRGATPPRHSQNGPRRAKIRQWKRHAEQHC